MDSRQTVGFSPWAGYGLALFHGLVRTRLDQVMNTWSCESRVIIKILSLVYHVMNRRSPGFWVPPIPARAGHK